MIKPEVKELLDEFYVLTQQRMREIGYSPDQIEDYLTIKLVAEAGEFANLIGKLRFGMGIGKGGLENEAADTLIFLYALHKYMDLNLEQGLERKLKLFHEKLKENPV